MAKKKKRRKLKVKRLFLTLILIALIAYLGYYIVNMPIKNIYVEGNNYITEEEIILLERMNYGYDKIDLNSLVHLIEWYNNQNILVQ